MKTISIAKTVLASLLIGCLTFSFADTFQIINNTGSILQFQLIEKSNILPNFPENQPFSLANRQIALSQTNFGNTPDTLEAYFGVKESFLHGTKNAFFGVAKDGVHGYMDNGIAYSWSGSAVTFCTPEYYQAHNGNCFPLGSSATP